MVKNIDQLAFFSSKNQNFGKAKEDFDFLISHKVTKVAVKISFVLIFFSLAVLTIFWKRIPPKIPLFYTKPWGEDQLSKDFFIWLLPGSSLIFTLLNLRIASLIYKSEQFLSQLLVWGNVTFCLLATIALVRILMIVV